MITHYGLFWKERDVFWGRQKNKGELQRREKTPQDGKGAPTTADKKKYKDYRGFVGLYCLYGEGNLIYIGEAGLGKKRSLFDRLKEHRKGPLSKRWDTFSWFGREKSDGESPNLNSLQQLEAIAISITNPGFNRQSGAFAKAIQVYQVIHDEAEGDLETKIDRLIQMQK